MNVVMHFLVVKFVLILLVSNICIVYVLSQTTTTQDPSYIPTAGPTPSPSNAPTKSPSDSPTLTPSHPPTTAPTNSPTATPTQSPSQPPTIAPSGLPTITPSQSPSKPPTSAPSSNPSYIPSNAPSLSPIRHPTNSPTASPSIAPTLRVETGVLYLIYDDPNIAGNVLDLSLLQYADDLQNATQQALTLIFNYSQSVTGQPTSYQTICQQFNKTLDLEGNSCKLSNINPFHNSNSSTTDDDDDDGTSMRRNMLDQDYSYYYDDSDDGTSGWWQGRVDNLIFCVVFNLEWDPQHCSGSGRYEDEEFDITLQGILDNTENWRDDADDRYYAVALFDYIADENAQNFENYLTTILAVQNDDATNTTTDNTDDGETSTDEDSEEDEEDDSGYTLDLNEIFKTNLSSVMNDLRGYSNDSKASKWTAVSVIITDQVSKLNSVETDEFANVAFAVSYILYGFIGLCFILAVVAKIHAFLIGADNVRVMGIIYFGIWVFDFISDVIFASRMFDQGKKYYIHGILSVIFVIVPWVLNIRQLLKYERKWIQDPSISDRISEWLIKYGRRLVLCTCLCGSAFSVIEICNSHAFGTYFFTMGLTERHLKKFNSSRLYSTIICENLPQLGVQIWYFIVQSDFDVVAVFAFLSSIISVFIALIDVYSSHAFVMAIKAAQKADPSFKGYQYFFEIIGDIIDDNKHWLMMRPNAIRKLFAEILEIDERCIELTLCVKIHGGIQFGFALYTTDKVPRFQRLQRIYESINHPDRKKRDFIKGILKLWSLEELNSPKNLGRRRKARYKMNYTVTNIVTIYDIRVGFELKEYTMDHQAIDNSPFCQEHPWVYGRKRLGNFAIIDVNTIRPSNNNNYGIGINPESVSNIDESGYSVGGLSELGGSSRWKESATIESMQSVSGYNATYNRKEYRNKSSKIDIIAQRRSLLYGNGDMARNRTLGDEFAKKWIKKMVALDEQQTEEIIGRNYSKSMHNRLGAVETVAAKISMWEERVQKSKDTEKQLSNNRLHAVNNTSSPEWSSRNDTVDIVFDGDGKNGEQTSTRARVTSKVKFWESLRSSSQSKRSTTNANGGGNDMSTKGHGQHRSISSIGSLGSLGSGTGTDIVMSDLKGSFMRGKAVLEMNGINRKNKFVD